MIEVPLFDPESVDLKRTRDLLQQHRLSPSVSLGLTAETDISSPERAVSNAGIAQLNKIVDATAFIGGSTVAGVIGSAWQKYLALHRCGLQKCGLRNPGGGQGSARKGVTLAVEVVNRFEFEPPQHGRSGDPLRRRGWRGQCRHPPRHVPHAYRGTGRPGGDPRVRDRLRYSTSTKTTVATSTREASPLRPYSGRSCREIRRRHCVRGLLVLDLQPVVAGKAAVWRSVFEDGEDVRRALDYLKSGMASARTIEMAGAARSRGQFRPCTHRPPTAKFEAARHDRARD